VESFEGGQRGNEKESGGASSIDEMVRFLLIDHLLHFAGATREEGVPAVIPCAGIVFIGAERQASVVPTLCQECDEGQVKMSAIKGRHQ